MTTPNAEIETMDDDETEWTTCDGCLTAMTAADYDAGDTLCPACVAAHATCTECGERVLKTDMHPAVKGLCESCGDEQIEAEHQDALDDATNRLDELVDDLKAGEDLELIRRAIKAVRKLTAK